MNLEPLLVRQRTPLQVVLQHVGVSRIRKDVHAEPSGALPPCAQSWSKSRAVSATSMYSQQKTEEDVQAYNVGFTGGGTFMIK